MEKEIEIIIEPNSSSMRYYCISYRHKKRFNLFNSWKKLVEVWAGASLTYYQPVLFLNYDNAVSYGKKLKKNPNLIEEHYNREDKKYEEAKKRRIEYHNKRNKSVRL